MWIAFSATFDRQLKTMHRAYPWSFFIGHILDGIYMIIFAYLSYHFIFRGQLNQQFSSYSGTTNYLAYAIIGGMLNSFSVSLLMIVSRMLITEMREGTLEALLLTPSSRLGYFLGAAVQGLMRSSIELAAICCVGLFFGLQIFTAHAWLLFPILVAFCFAIFAQALVLGSFMLIFRDTYITQNTLFILMMLVSGVSFPPQFLPVWVHSIGAIMPLSYGLNLFRGVVLQQQWSGQMTENLLALLTIGSVYFIIGLAFIRRSEKTVVEKYFG
ncbi:MAG: ABC transporter permease [Sporolactobacillus sp.]